MQTLSWSFISTTHKRSAKELASFLVYELFLLNINALLQVTIYMVYLCKAYPRLLISFAHPLLVGSRQSPMSKDCHRTHLPHAGKRFIYLLLLVSDDNTGSGRVNALCVVSASSTLQAVTIL